MEITNAHILEKINFSDFEVFGIALDKKAKSINFTIKGGWYLDAGKRFELGEGYFKNYTDSRRLAEQQTLLNKFVEQNEIQNSTSRRMFT